MVVNQVPIIPNRNVTWIPNHFVPIINDPIPRSTFEDSVSGITPDAHNTDPARPPSTSATDTATENCPQSPHDAEKVDEIVSTATDSDAPVIQDDEQISDTVQTNQGPINVSTTTDRIKLIRGQKRGVFLAVGDYLFAKDKDIKGKR